MDFCKIFQTDFQKKFLIDIFKKLNEFPQNFPNGFPQNFLNEFSIFLARAEGRFVGPKGPIFINQPSPVVNVTFEIWYFARGSTLVS